MSNSIWHDRYVELPEDVFVNSVRPCVIAVDENKKIIGANYGLKGSIPEIKYWARVDDLIAQADKAERLEKENEAMREEFEVWHGNHKCVLEDKERLQKVVFFLSGHLRDVLQLDEYGHIKLDEITKQQIKTAISDPVGIITQLEQESNN